MSHTSSNTSISKSTSASLSSTHNPNKPLSPHLGIYKPQITSIMSIFHRFTGIGLFFGFLALIWMLFIYVYDYSKLNHIREFFFENNIGKIFLYIWIFGLFFHTLNGIRYLFWSMGIMMEMKSVKSSAWIVLSCAIICTVLVFYIL